MIEILVIGGMTVDIEGVPHDKLIMQDSNLGKINFSYGGVGRNVAENIAKLALKPGLISLVGDDDYGKKLLADCKSKGINVDNVTLLKNQQTAMYMSILNENRNMELAINSMDIFDNVGIEAIKNKQEVIDGTELIVLDTNINEAWIDYILANHSDKKIFLDPVSVTKAKKIKNNIGRFTIIKPNKIEAEFLSGIKIVDEESLEKAGEFFISKGVENIFITLGQEGVYYKDRKNSGRVKVPFGNIISATGAGDAFSSGVIYGYYHNLDSLDMAIYGCAAAQVALLGEGPVSEKMNKELIGEIAIKIKEINGGSYEDRTLR